MAVIYKTYFSATRSHWRPARWSSF